MSSKLTAGDLQIVTRLAVFRGLKSETVEHIIAPATAVMLRPHEWIVRQGDPATAFFIVIDGWVKLYRNTAAGDETVIDIMTKGESFAEAVAFTGNRYLATAEAVTEARVGRIPADHIVRCIRQSPDIALAMIASISQHMHHLVQQVEQLKAQSGVQRVAEFLASLSSAEQGHCALVLPYDKVLIAGRLGLTPESLSRAFARLRAIGVVVDASCVVVRDVAKLRQLATDDRSAVRGTLRSVRLR
jgi:CRP-like cAMP-binding protein